MKISNGVRWLGNCHAVTTSVNVREVGERVGSMRRYLPVKLLRGVSGPRPFSSREISRGEELLNRRGLRIRNSKNPGPRMKASRNDVCVPSPLSINSQTRVLSILAKGGGGRRSARKRPRKKRKRKKREGNL